MYSHLGKLTQCPTNRDNTGVDVDWLEVGEEVFKLESKGNSVCIYSKYINEDCVTLLADL